jgi:hypothetical protein
MKAWHLVLATVAVAFLVIGYAALHASGSASEYVAPPILMRHVSRAGESHIAPIRSAASLPSHPRVVARPPHFGRPHVKPLRRVSTDEWFNGACSDIHYRCAIDPCRDVPESLDTCASYSSAEAINSCVESRVTTEHYQDTYC